MHDHQFVSYSFHLFHLLCYLYHLLVAQISAVYVPSELWARASQPFLKASFFQLMFSHSTRRLLHGRARLEQVLPRKMLLRGALFGHQHLGKELGKEFLGKELLLRGLLLRRRLLRTRLLGRRLLQTRLFGRLLRRRLLLVGPGRDLWLFFICLAGLFHAGNGLHKHSYSEEARKAKSSQDNWWPDRNHGLGFPYLPLPALGPRSSHLRWPRGCGPGDAAASPAAAAVAPSFPKAHHFPSRPCLGPLPPHQQRRGGGAADSVPTVVPPRTAPPAHPFPDPDLSWPCAPTCSVLEVLGCDLQTCRRTPERVGGGQWVGGGAD